MFNSLEEEIANLEKVVRDLRHELAAANHREESLRAQDERSSLSIRCSDFHILTYLNSLEQEIANLEKTVHDLRHELITANQKQESLNKSINSLRAQVEKSSKSQ